MPKHQEDYTPEDMLQVFGLRVGGGKFTNPSTVSTGQQAELDKDECIVAYVATTPGYGRAEALLKHVYAHFLPLSAFRITEAGETLVHALLRRSWGDMIGLRRDKIVETIFYEFHDTFTDRCIKDPLVFPAEIVDPDEAERDAHEARKAQDAEFAERASKIA